MTEILTALNSIITIVSGFVIVYLAWRRFPLEQQTSGSSAANEVSEAVKTLIPPLRERITELETENDKLESENQALKLENETMISINTRLESLRVYDKARIDLLDDWAKRLVEQVRRMGEEPVGFDNGKSGKI